MAKNTIKLKNYSKVFEEYIAAGVITPGFLLEYTSEGKVQAHSSAGQNMIPMFALEDELQGNGITDAYEVDNQVQVWVPGRGDEVYALLKDGEDVAKGDFLESDGNGYLQKHVAESSSYTNQIVAQALEAVDLSGSSGVDPATQRIEVRIV